MFEPILLLLLSFTIKPSQQNQSNKNDIATIVQQGAGSEPGRAAWNRLSNGGPELLPLLLKAMDSDDIVRCNWLRIAFERIVDREIKTKSNKINIQPLLQFAKDAKRQGRARRFALEVVERLQRGTMKKFLDGKLDDPEFRYDAVDLLLTEAEKTQKAGAKQSLVLFRRALNNARDLQQARRAAVGLLDLGEKVSLAKHFGFLTEWHVIGPFDAKNKIGFAKSFPPEQKVDLNATYTGQSNKIRWKRYTVQETSPRVRSRHVALVNLREARALGDADDAVAYAFTVINIPKARRVEFRGAADDNLTVWVNGKKVFAFEEYNNGVRHDRHRFPVQMQKGKNTILVKVVQSPPYIAPNWEFILRLADETGKGVEFEYALGK